MNTVELLAPAGSPEALSAALHAGADAVYLACGDFNARRGAKNFSREDLATALSDCRARGVAVYLTLNTLLTDRELPAALELAAFATRLGVTAIIVQDLGLVRLLRQRLPDTPLHASTQMTIHNRGGLQLCADLGMERVVLARELSHAALATLRQDAPLELEVFAHGALCMSYSGQCYFSALVGERSGNRGLCAQPCRLPYRRAEDKNPSYPLSLKDLSLAGSLDKLSALGLSCLKLEGRGKRPEYVSIVTALYATLLREQRAPTKQEEAMLGAAFSRNGFTDGYYQGKKNQDMFGTRPEGERMSPALRSEARTAYTGKETPHIPLDILCSLRADEPARLCVQDTDGHCCTVEGPVPEPARTKALSATQVEVQLRKTGGTIFLCHNFELHLDEGLSLPLSALGALRRAALTRLYELRAAPPARTVLPPLLPIGSRAARSNAPQSPLLSVSLSRFEQLSDALLQETPAFLFLPVAILAAHKAALAAYQRRFPQTRFGVTLPRIATDAEFPRLHALLEECRALGIEDALLGNLGFVGLCRTLGFSLRGDFGLGICNSASMAQLTDLGFVSATASFELNFAQMRDLEKPIHTEALVYGRLPMMLTEHCLSPRGAHCQNCPDTPCAAPEGYLEDRKHERFPILPVFGGRSELLNAKVLYLADRRRDYERLGLWAARLLFTTEDQADCAALLRRYRIGSEERPDTVTRGLYYRRVE